MVKFLKTDKTTSQDLSAGALSYTAEYSKPYKLEQIVFQANTAITETITITIDSANGANYDTILARQSLISKQSFIFRPEGEANFHAGDKIKIQCTNANATGTVYVTIKARELN